MDKIGSDSHTTNWTLSRQTTTPRKKDQISTRPRDQSYQTMNQRPKRTCASLCERMRRESEVDYDLKMKQALDKTQYKKGKNNKVQVKRIHRSELLSFNSRSKLCSNCQEDYCKYQCQNCTIHVCESCTHQCNRCSMSVCSRCVEYCDGCQQLLCIDTCAASMQLITSNTTTQQVVNATSSNSSSNSKKRRVANTRNKEAMVQESFCSQCTESCSLCFKLLAKKHQCFLHCSQCKQTIICHSCEQLNKTDTQCQQLWKCASCHILKCHSCKTCPPPETVESAEKEENFQRHSTCIHCGIECCKTCQLPCDCQLKFTSRRTQQNRLWGFVLKKSAISGPDVSFQFTDSL